jgi:hypothetical protein
MKPQKKIVRDEAEKKAPLPTRVDFSFVHVAAWFILSVKCPRRQGSCQLAENICSATQSIMKGNIGNEQPVKVCAGSEKHTVHPNQHIGKENSRSSNEHYRKL